MDQRGHFERQPALAFAGEGALGDGNLQGFYLCPGQEGEHLQPRGNVGISGVEPELVEGVGAAHLRIKPDGVALALSELGAVRIGDERRAKGMHVLALHLADKFGTAGEVAPLVRAAGLQDTAVVTEELEVVHALQDLVAELGVTDALIRTETGGNGILAEHGADPEVLADFAKEIDGAKRGSPVEVIDHPGGVVAVKAQEAAHLGLKVPDPFGNGVLGVQGAFRRRPRITDQAGGSAYQAQRLVAGELKAAHQEQLHEVAQVQAGSGWIEPAVIGDRVPGEQLFQFHFISGYVDQAAPVELLPDVGKGRIVLLGLEII
ncbi:hypothetical protein D9M72_306350 [compost metagenome]